MWLHSLANWTELNGWWVDNIMWGNFNKKPSKVGNYSALFLPSSVYVCPPWQDKKLSKTDSLSWFDTSPSRGKSISISGVTFINTKRRLLKCQKWRLTFRKFQNTLLAFQMPKYGVFITNSGILYAKQQGI